MGKTHIIGSILGTAVGDAIGLPYEGLSPRRGALLLGKPNQQRLLLGFGMVSDDTEHTCMVAQALIASGKDPLKFRDNLALQLRWWLLKLPVAIGLATLQAILRLWCGISPSGVFSAGNGPAMRAAILGVTIDDLVTLKEFVRISASITHTDPKAFYGAFAIALAAWSISNDQSLCGEKFLRQLTTHLGREANEFISLIEQVVDSVSTGEATSRFAAKLGMSKGVSGYVYHSVPIALHAAFSNQDNFTRAIITTVECGGDTDSTAAMVGGIVGAAVGKEGIKKVWLDKLGEPFCSVRWMENLAIQLHRTIQSRTPEIPLKMPLLGVLVRNLLFVLTVSLHGLRRLLPPY